MKRLIIAGVLVLIALVLTIMLNFNSQEGALEDEERVGSIFVVDSEESQENIEAGGNGMQQNNEELLNSPSTHEVKMTSSGFSPQTLTINAGDTVIWGNENSKDHWPASAMHPTHTIYPGSSIDKCDTEEEPEIFDACRGISPGKSYSFTFDEIGSWNYHDHLNPSMYGKIVVE